MAVMQMGAYSVVAKTAIIGRQVVDVAHQDGLAIFSVVNRARGLAVKSPKGLGGQIRRYGSRNLRLGDLIELLRRELCKCLMSNGSSFARSSVGSYGWRGIQGGYRLFYSQSPEWLDKRPGWGAGSTATTAVTTTALAAMVETP